MTSMARIVGDGRRLEAYIAADRCALSHGKPPGMKDWIFSPRVPVPESDPVCPPPCPQGAPAPYYNKLRWRYGESPWLRSRENFADLVVVERVMGPDATRHLLWTAQAALRCNRRRRPTTWKRCGAGHRLPGVSELDAGLLRCDRAADWLHRRVRVGRPTGLPHCGDVGARCRGRSVVWQHPPLLLAPGNLRKLVRQQERAVDS